MNETHVSTSAEITGHERTTFLNELENQPLPFEWRCVSTRTLGLYLDGQDTPIYIMLNDDGTWSLNACIQI